MPSDAQTAGRKVVSETPEMQAAREIWRLPANSDPTIGDWKDRCAAIIREKATGPLRDTLTTVVARLRLEWEKPTPVTREDVQLLAHAEALKEE